MSTTLVVYDWDELAKGPELAYVVPELRAGWLRFAQSMTPERLAGAHEELRFLQRVVKVLHASSVPLLVGTDAMGWPFMIPGASFHQELALLVDAGLSPYDVLRCATVEPAHFLNIPASLVRWLWDNVQTYYSCRGVPCKTSVPYSAYPAS